MNTREKILGKTEEFILENGIEKLTISKIAKELNISQPAIYKHFKSKDELLTILALRWLNGQTLVKIFPFDTSKYIKKRLFMIGSGQSPLPNMKHIEKPQKCLPYTQPTLEKI